MAMWQLGVVNISPYSMGDCLSFKLQTSKLENFLSIYNLFQTECTLTDKCGTPYILLVKMDVKLLISLKNETPCKLDHYCDQQRAQLEHFFQDSHRNFQFDIPHLEQFNNVVHTRLTIIFVVKFALDHPERVHLNSTIYQY